MANLVAELNEYGYNSKEETYLVGDMNFDTSEKNALTRYLNKLNFSQIIQHATHLDGLIIDHIYTRHEKSDLVKIKQHHVY